MANGESQYWDTIGQRGVQKLPDQTWRAHSDAINSRLLERWLSGGKVQRLLKTDAFDEASGVGLLPHLKSRAQLVVEIDISPVTLAAAHSRHSDFSSAAADVRAMPFRNDAFDAIVSNSTLDHFATMEELELSFRELYRALRPGGQLVLTLDNPSNPAVGLRNALPYGWLNRIGLVPYFVGATCAKGKLEKTLRGIGFDILAIDAVLHCPRALAVLISRMFSRDSAGRQRFLKFLMSFEKLSCLPTRFFTGYFTAVLARKPQ